jgi:hypothetical protein
VPAASGFDRGHEACRARSEDEDIETVLIHGANFPNFIANFPNFIIDESIRACRIPRLQ